MGPDDPPLSAWSLLEFKCRIRQGDDRQDYSLYKERRISVHKFVTTDGVWHLKFEIALRLSPAGIVFLALEYLAVQVQFKK